MNPTTIGAERSRTPTKSTSNAVRPVTRSVASTGGCVRRIVRTSARASSLSAS
jgi:hypothetical protein